MIWTRYRLQSCISVEKNLFSISRLPVAFFVFSFLVFMVGGVVLWSVVVR